MPLFVFLIVSLFTAVTTHAADDRFHVALTSHYTYTATGSSEVRQDFSVTNLTSKYLTSGYEIFYPGNIPPGFTGFDAKGKLTFQTEKKTGGTSIRIIFNSVAAGKDESLNFTLVFTGPPAIRHDNVWEISLPKLASPEDISDYTLKLSVPLSFGLLAYSTLPPVPASEDYAEKLAHYSFSDIRAATEGITAAFGDFQTWGFILDYELPPSDKSGQMKILLPSDTVGQKISLSKIDPKPDNIIADDVGNWTASFSRKSTGPVKIQVTGQIRLFAPKSTESSFPAASIIAFSPPGIDPNPNYVRPYQTKIIYDVYAASFPKISLRWQTPLQLVPWLPVTTYLEITNSGNVAAYSLPVTVQSQGLQISPQSTTIDIIPPLSSYRLPVTTRLWPRNILAPKIVGFQTNNQSITYNIPTQKLFLTYGIITIISTFTLLAAAAFAHRAGSVHIQKHRRSGNLRRQSEKS